MYCVISLDKDCEQLIPTSRITMKRIGGNTFQIECSNKQDKSYLTTTSWSYPFQTDFDHDILLPVRLCSNTYKYNSPVLDCFRKYK